jgi:hypothetical protein
LALDILRRRETAVAITVVCFLIIVGDTYLKLGTIKAVSSALKRWMVVIIAPSMGLAMIQLIRWNRVYINRRERGWWINILTICIMFIAFFSGLIPPKFTASPPMEWLVLHIIVPCMGVGYSVIALCYVGAWYRAMRIRSIETGALVISAIVVYCMEVPLINMLWPGSQPFGSWYLTYASMGANYAISISWGLATVALALRAITGRERGYFR